MIIANVICALLVGWTSGFFFGRSTRGKNNGPDSIRGRFFSDIRAGDIVYTKHWGHMKQFVVYEVPYIP